MWLCTKDYNNENHGDSTKVGFTSPDYEKENFDDYIKKEKIHKLELFIPDVEDPSKEKLLVSCFEFADALVNEDEIMLIRSNQRGDFKDIIKSAEESGDNNCKKWAAFAKLGTGL